MRRIAFALVALFVLGSCTEANLYSPAKQRKEANRLSLEGRVCTEDPVRARFPVRVVLMVDRANGPLFSDYDPAGTRIGLLQSFVQDALRSSETEMAVIGYGGRPARLAPTDGDFTRNPGEIFNAVTQLSLAQNCIDVDQCRDYRDAIRSARALIEGELATMPAGLRVLTQFVVIMVNAGPQSPLANGQACCQPDDQQCLQANDGPSAACETQLGAGEVESLAEMVGESGAAGLKFHGIHFAAEPDAATNDQVQEAMEAMAFAGGGVYQRFNSIQGFSDTALDLLELRTVLRAKLLLAANINARPGPDGPVVDSDADGLSDREEEAIGTEPTNPDTDGDGITDRVEVFAGLDPLAVDEPPTCRELPVGGDLDLDLLTDCDEELLGTEASLVDSDGDGLPDSLEVFYGTDYVNRDAESDVDGDGVTNGDEILQHTDPRSTDTRAHLSFGYRYDIVDEGVNRELFAGDLTLITGVDVVSMSEGTTAGIGTMRYDAADQTLSWQDAGDPDPGPAKDVSNGGVVVLESSSFAPVQGSDGRRITVNVSLPDLPPDDQVEQVRIIFQERQCLTYAIRNIQMMATEGGLNNIILYFAEAPQGRATVPGPFRMAQIPVVFDPPDTRDPPEASLIVGNDEFVRPNISPSGNF